MRKLVALVIILAVLGFGASRAYDWWSYELNTPVSTASEPVTYHVQVGELPADVAGDLDRLHLLRNRTVFEWYVRISGVGSKFQAGSFLLNRNMTMVQIADALQRGGADQIVITIPEGYPLKFQANFVEKDWPGMGAPYLRAAADPSWGRQYDFLGTRPAGADPPLEGYLFPDTYSVDPSAGVNGLIKQQLDQFGTVFSPDLRAQIAQSASGRPAESIENIVILASMVEREANKDSDRGNVCSVYYNRLAINMPLGVDATLLYYLGRLTPEPTYPELQLNVPFNTRKHPGLPPGPISNPGKAALLACINPPKTAYLYYFTDRNGTTHFETNEADFNKDIQKYGVSGS
ncbi:MAG TPA: endolytic transglycosylase MltG [Candidatus Dormibacteraeota bacterium]|nr:endolytic transglycosylase MltG [Candidatus Dormibacteraeota bacterium]